MTGLSSGAGEQTVGGGGERGGDTTIGCAHPVFPRNGVPYRPGWSPPARLRRSAISVQERSRIGAGAIWTTSWELSTMIITPYSLGIQTESSWTSDIHPQASQSQWHNFSSHPISLQFHHFSAFLPAHVPASFQLFSPEYQHLPLKTPYCLQKLKRTASLSYWSLSASGIITCALFYWRLIQNI